MRRAASGLAKSLRALSAPCHKESSAGTLWHSNGSCRAHSALLSGGRTDHVLRWNTDSACSVQGRHLSGKPSSPESVALSASKKESVQSSTKSDASLSLVSSEGSTKSLLTGPRITSKKGYLERETMIRETQKAIRQYYKEGMYQVQRTVEQYDIIEYALMLTKLVDYTLVFCFIRGA